MSKPKTYQFDIDVGDTSTTTVYSDKPANGYVTKVEFVAGHLTAQAEAALTGETTGVAIWSDIGTMVSSFSKEPRIQTCDTSGTAATFDGTRVVLDRIAIADERLKLVVTDTAKNRTGTFYVTVE